MQYTIGGKVVDADELKRIGRTVPKKASTPKTDQSYHKGWRVVGHPPGVMEAARSLRESELARWAGMSEQRKIDARASGEREPKPWDEAQWRRTTTPKAVRSKPYEVPEAAEVCAEMARGAGWLDVVVVEQKRGEAE